MGVDVLRVCWYSGVLWLWVLWYCAGFVVSRFTLFIVCRLLLVSSSLAVCWLIVLVMSHVCVHSSYYFVVVVVGYK